MCFDNSRPLDPLESNHTPGRGHISNLERVAQHRPPPTDDRPPPTDIQPVARKALHSIPGVGKFTVALKITNRISPDRPTPAQDLPDSF